MSDDWSENVPLKHAYAKAMAAGLLALQGMIDDLDDGPRESEPATRPAKRAAFAFAFGSLK